MFCNQSGDELPVNAKFCHICGAKTVAADSSNVNNPQNNTDAGEGEEFEHDICDKLALKGDYKGAIKALSPSIEEADSYFENFDPADLETDGGRKQYAYHRYMNELGSISRAKLFYLLGDYDKAFEDIGNIIADEDEAAPEDMDCFDNFSAPSLKKVCRKLEKEGYDLPFDIDDIKEI